MPRGTGPRSACIWPPILAAVLLVAAGAGARALARRYTPSVLATADGASTGGVGDLTNPRRLDCSNRNMFFVGEESYVYHPAADDLVAGPLALPGLRAWAHAQPGDHGSDHRYKVGVIVRAGQTVTLSIPAEFHEVAGLLYGSSWDDIRTPAAADHTVTFTACRAHDTVFVGGFLVLAPRCVPLVIHPVGKRPVREVVSFFAGDC
jgi:hypothetical protein